MPKAIITVGISCSGKTTWAEEWCRTNNAVNVNRDDIRFTNIYSGGNWSTYKFTSAKERLVTEIQEKLCEAAIESGKNVVISDTNLKQSRVDAWKKFLKDLGFDVEVKVFDVTLELAWKRDSARENGVGHDVIYNQWLQYQKMMGRKTNEGDASLPNAVIFDVDGTLASMEGRSPFEWHRVGEDKPRHEVFAMLYGYHYLGYKIIIMSGRDGCCEEETRKWLNFHLSSSVSYVLHIRAKDDVRKDTVIKEEIFWEHISDNYNVKAVVDDRPCMIRLWNSLKIPSVVSVGDPWKEF